MSRVKLTLATSHYDHLSDLTNGHVPVEGVDLTSLIMRVEEVFHRFIVFRDFDVGEVSLAKYSSMISQGDNSLVAIPVFPSRVPRHSSIYVMREGPVQRPSDLAGRTVGLPEWAQTASVYVRGLLMHQYGVDLSSVTWIQAGVDQTGRIEKVKLRLPNGLRLIPAPDKTLSGMLVAGEVDAIFSASPPSCFTAGKHNVKRLFEDFVAREMKYVQETGIFPIMHTIAFRAEVLESHPWLAMNLYSALEEAKARSVKRALFSGVSSFPIPWFYEHARSAQELLGGDLWPYGIEPNRKTLTAFLQYAHEQGVCHQQLEPEQLFAARVQQQFRT